MIPRIAVSQAPYLRDVDESLGRAIRHMRQAASRGADIIVFPEWFLGLNPVEMMPNRFTERLSRAAQELNLAVVTGSIRSLEPENGKKQQRGLAVEADGTLAGSQAKMQFLPTERPWFEPGTGITPIPTRWGRFVLLLGLDALDPALWEECQEYKPNVVVMAANPRTSAERTALQELAVSRSLKARALVVLAPLMGRFAGTHYLGGALVAHEGRILATADDHERVLVTGDPEAPLIQLGVTDASACVPIASPPADPVRTMGPEAERKVVLDWDALTHPDTMANGRALIELSRQNPRWAALAPAKPQKARELAKLLEEGAAGAFAYPGLDHLPPWSESVMEWGGVLKAYRRPLVVHSGPGAAPLRFDHPSDWDEFLQRHPSIPVVLLHMGGRSPFLEEALLLAERHSQVFLETSGAPTGAIKEAVAHVGPKRILFGSGGLAPDFHREWERFHLLEADLASETFQSIINANARALFFVERSDVLRPEFTVIRRPG